MKIYLLPLFNLIAIYTYCQVYSIVDTIPYQVTGFSKKECFDKFQDKIANLKVSDSINISLSEDKNVFIGKGKLPYNHNINFDTTDAFINKTYIGQPKGHIAYKIKIEFQKKLILITIFDFEHIAKGTPWGKKSVGKINFAYVPLKTKDEELIWFEKVKKDVVNYCEMFNTKFKLWFFNSLL